MYDRQTESLWSQLEHLQKEVSEKEAKRACTIASN
jgi:hypothetical protein